MRIFEKQGVIEGRVLVSRSFGQIKMELAARSWNS